MLRYDVQPGSENYRDAEHDDIVQWLSYWHQIEEVLRLRPQRVLEVGIGNGTTSTYLRARGIHVDTIDHDRLLRPSITGSLGSLPVRDGSYDCVVCCQVLEHIRFEDVPAAIRDLRRVSNRWLVLSLPYSCLFVGIAALPFYALALDPLFRVFSLRQNQPVSVTLRMPFWFLRRPSHPNHHWEMGQRGTSLRVIRSLFRKEGLQIVRQRNHLLYGYHYYFVLRRSDDGADAHSQPRAQ